MNVVIIVYNAILYVYPSVKFTQWLRNDTSMTRAGMIKGIYFQYLVSIVMFVTMMILSVITTPPKDDNYG